MVQVWNLKKIKACLNAKVVFEIVKKDQLYFLNSVNVSKCVLRPLQQWHEIMGHCNTKDVMQLDAILRM